MIRSNNRQIYDKCYVERKNTEQRNQFENVMYFGYNENASKCNGPESYESTVYPFNLVDVESELKNIGLRKCSLCNQTAYKPEKTPPTMTTTQVPICNPDIYPVVENNIKKDTEPFKLF